MIIRRHGPGYNFWGDTETGLTLHWGATLDENPERAPWPELADISISNQCSKGCAFCYRESVPGGAFMSAEEYAYVIECLRSERWGSVFQVALGGGEPLEHPEFFKILDETQKRNIVANFTTNGLLIDPSVARRLRGRIGAVALSVRSIAEIPVDKIAFLAEAGVTVNLHFILDSESILEAIELLDGKANALLKGLHAVIFLTYKPKGRANPAKCLELGGALEWFLAKVNANQCATRIGFDACFVPLLMHGTEVNVDTIDSCECGFFSIYIDEALNVKPCSFANTEEFTFNLASHSMESIWEERFAPYRAAMSADECAADCRNKAHCRGRCHYYDSLAFCHVSA